jgi:transcriptional regulator with XRE-family HTH domain
MSQELQRKTLGDFLKARRTQLTPKQVGLPDGHTRRRTAGLRREEVAQLANISNTWYTWLEQGRDVTVSADVLDSISKALRLSELERQHLYRLSSKFLTFPLEKQQRSLSPSFKLFMENTPYPMCVTGENLEVFAWNKAAKLILFDFDAIPPKERVMIRLYFSEEAKLKINNWEEIARYAISVFRKTYDVHAAEPFYKEIVEDLMESSSEFREWWPLHQIQDTASIFLEVNHPQAGKLVFDSTTFHQVDDNQNILCCIYAPVPHTQTVERIEKLFHPLKKTI